MDLAHWFPGLAARYWRRRNEVEYQKRLYKAALSTAQRPRRGDGRSGDATMEHARGTLRNWARYLDENSDLASGVLDTLSNNIVGTGIVVAPMARLADGAVATRQNELIARAWQRWIERPETSGVLPWEEAQRLLCRTWLRDGEALLQHIEGRTSYPYATPVPYVLELIESDLLPFDLLNDNPSIVHGVERDQWQRVTAYYLYLEHPGNTYVPLRSLALLQETRRIAADQMIHLKNIRRLHQARGVSLFASIITRLDDLNEYEESERIAAKVAAQFAGVIQRQDDFSWDASKADQTLQLQSGLILDRLQPGETIDTLDPKRPSNALTDYRAAMLRAAAAGAGTGYSTISRDYNGTYSAQRQELVETRVSYDRLRNYFISTLVRPVYRRWLALANLSGEISLSGLDPARAFDAIYRGPGMPWIDPLKEAQADELNVRAGFKSRHQIIRERGGDPMEVDAERAEDTFESAPESTPDTEVPDEERDAA